MEFPVFFNLVGGVFRVRLDRACALAGVNYQTACNQICRDRKRPVGTPASFPLRVHHAARNVTLVDVRDLFDYLYPQDAVPVVRIERRGKPSSAEVAEAKRLGMSVPQLRRARIVGGAK